MEAGSLADSNEYSFYGHEIVDVLIYNLRLNYSRQ